MDEHVTRWPLAWPTGWKRTPAHARKAPRFHKTEKVSGSNGGSWNRSRPLTFGQASDRLEAEVGRLGAQRPMISSNVEIGLRGNPLASDAERKHDDPGVALYFTLKGQARCLACDVYTTVAANVAAIAAHIDALRRIDRYGVGTLDQAFAGYAPRLQAASLEWWLVLDVPRTATRGAVELAYEKLAKVAHPDRGGSHDAMARLNEARDIAYAALEAQGR